LGKVNATVRRSVRCSRGWEAGTVTDSQAAAAVDRRAVDADAVEEDHRLVGLRETRVAADANPRAAS
jgi:hypothetical protein